MPDESPNDQRLDHDHDSGQDARQDTAADNAADLVAWVREVLAPGISRDFNPKGQLRWCRQWWDHPEAVARLWAMAGAYAVLVDADDAPADGPSTWWLQHADPHLTVLLNKDTGPFSQCTHEHRITGGLPWQEPTRPVVLPVIAGPPQDAGAAAAAVE
jgi:hypothetical protein